MVRALEFLDLEAMVVGTVAQNSLSPVARCLPAKDIIADLWEPPPMTRA
jgi:hypothetical protein